MTTSSPSILYDNSTDALFRAWGSAIDTAVLAVSWLAASDTGQIDFTTVLKPSAAAQSRGFKMYKTNDGGTDVYMKIEFGSGGFGALHPAVYFSWGWTTDGAGTFTGLQKSSRYEIRITNGNVAATANTTNRFCYKDGAFVWTNNENLITNAYQPVVAFDRYRNGSTGATLNTGFHVFAVTTNSSNAIVRDGAGSPRNQESCPSSGGTWGSFGGNMISPGYPSNSASWSRGLVKGASTFHGWDAGTLPATIAIISVSAGIDDVAGTEDTTTIYGVSRTYRVFAPNVPFIAATTASGTVAHLFE